MTIRPANCQFVSLSFFFHPFCYDPFLPVPNTASYWEVINFVGRIMTLCLISAALLAIKFLKKHKSLSVMLNE